MLASNTDKVETSRELGNTLNLFAVAVDTDEQVNKYVMSDNATLPP